MKKEYCDACLIAGEKKLATKRITINGVSHQFCEDCYLDFLLEANKKADELIGQVMYYCLRCGHSWPPKNKKPKTCPKCNSPYWDRKRRTS